MKATKYTVHIEYNNGTLEDYSFYNNSLDAFDSYQYLNLSYGVRFRESNNVWVVVPWHNIRKTSHTKTYVDDE